MLPDGQFVHCPTVPGVAAKVLRGHLRVATTNVHGSAGVSAVTLAGPCAYGFVHALKSTVVGYAVSSAPVLHTPALAIHGPPPRPTHWLQLPYALVYVPTGHSWHSAAPSSEMEPVHVVWAGGKGTMCPRLTGDSRAVARAARGAASVFVMVLAVVPRVPAAAPYVCPDHQTPRLPDHQTARPPHLVGRSGTWSQRSPVWG